MGGEAIEIVELLDRYLDAREKQQHWLGQIPDATRAEVVRTRSALIEALGNAFDLNDYQDPGLRR